MQSVYLVTGNPITQCDEDDVYAVRIRGETCTDPE